jgi:hypothetical protein
MPVTTPSTVTRALPCYIAKSLNFSPPFPRLGDVLHVGGYASGERDGECSESARSILCR